jgi:hypothetical protein
VNKAMTWLSVLGAILAGLIFFYPTPYRYEDGGMTRVNRFTGKVEVASSEGWAVAKPTVSPDKADPITPEVVKTFEAITVVAQDFDSVTLHNPGPWSLVLIEKAEVGFPDCGNASDYVTFITGDRSLSAGTDMKVRLPYPERFKKQVTSACGNGNHKRTVSLIVNSGNGPEGKRWDAQAKLVSRKIEGEVAVPAS